MRRLIKPAVLVFLALSLICLPPMRSGTLAQRRLHRRDGRPTRRGGFTGQPMVGGSLADDIKNRRIARARHHRRRSALIGAGAGAAGVASYHYRRRHQRRKSGRH